MRTSNTDASPLHSVATNQCSVRDGKRQVTDGLQKHGNNWVYFLIDAQDLDEAIRSPDGLESVKHVETDRSWNYQACHPSGSC